MLKTVTTNANALLLKTSSRCAAFLLAVGICMTVLAPSAHAQQQMVTDKDLEAAIRSLGFAYGLEKGDLSIEIVSDQGVPASAAEANRLNDMIKNTKTFASRTVHATIVPVAGIGSTGSKIAYVTHGLEKDYDAIAAKASAGKILTFSTDFQCVESSKCVMGVTGENIIKIEISRSATAASGIEFSQALKLMIGEVN